MAVTSCENANDTIIAYYNNRLYVLYTETNVTYFKHAFHSQWPWIRSHTGVQIWRIRWPIHPVVLPKKVCNRVCNNSCTMRSGVVILKHGHRTNMLEGRYDKRPDNLLQIAISVQVTINDIKRSSIIE